MRKDVRPCERYTIDLPRGLHRSSASLKEFNFTKPLTSRWYASAPACERVNGRSQCTSGKQVRKVGWRLGRKPSSWRRSAGSLICQSDMVMGEFRLWGLSAVIRGVVKTQTVWEPIPGSNRGTWTGNHLITCNNRGCGEPCQLLVNQCHPVRARCPAEPTESAHRATSLELLMEIISMDKLREMRANS